MNKEFDNSNTDFIDENENQDEAPFDNHRRFIKDPGAATSTVSLLNMTAISAVNETIVMDERKRPANINRFGKMSPTPIHEIGQKNKSSTS
jgi:hypothetical protein